MLTRADPALDRPMILFQDVIEMLHGAVLAIVGQIACGLEPGNGGWISGVLVGIDDPRRRMVLTAQRLWPECAQPLLHRVWPRARSRSSHRSNPQPGPSEPWHLQRDTGH